MPEHGVERAARHQDALFHVKIRVLSGDVCKPRKPMLFGGAPHLLALDLGNDLLGAVGVGLGRRKPCLGQVVAQTTEHKVAAVTAVVVRAAVVRNVLRVGLAGDVRAVTVEASEGAGN